jgi:AcrR family transcriptional regulator
MSKGDLTRSRILDQAMHLASRSGLDGLTIGSLSEALSLSKSGLFAHFGSKEALQVAVLQHTRARFGAHLEPRMRGAGKGLGALRAFARAWLDWLSLPELPAGCPLLGAGFELEAREGEPRDFLIKSHKDLRERVASMVRDAMDAGELRRNADTAQILFELRGITLAFHHELHVMRSPTAREHAEHAVSALLKRYAAEKPKRSR